jgi:hypothetical protein
VADFSILEQLRPIFHSIPFFHLPRSQTYHGKSSVTERYNTGRCTEVCELHFLSIVRVLNRSDICQCLKLRGSRRSSRESDNASVSSDLTASHFTWRFSPMGCPDSGCSATSRVSPSLFITRPILAVLLRSDRDRPRHPVGRDLKVFRGDGQPPSLVIARLGPTVRLTLILPHAFIHILEIPLEFDWVELVRVEHTCRSPQSKGHSRLPIDGTGCHWQRACVLTGRQLRAWNDERTSGGLRISACFSKRLSELRESVKGRLDRDQMTSGLGWVVSICAGDASLNHSLGP